jgi:TRAP-type C4-dicarboxylate transport system permease small subunit
MCENQTVSLTGMYIVRNFLQAAAALGMGVMLISTLLGVADRLFLGIGMSWTDELARFALVWTSLLAAAITLQHQRHFAFTAILEQLGSAGRIGVDLLMLAGLSVLAWYGIRLTAAVAVQTSPSLGIEMSWVYAAVPTFALVSICIFVLRIARWFTERPQC